jgi:defect-in-organelle-trafficking protein DotB
MTDFTLPNEPKKLTVEHFDLLLQHMNAVGASDTYIHTSETVLMDIQGNKTSVTTKPTTMKTVEDIAKEIAGDNAVSRLSAGESIDSGLEKRYDGKRFRYRTNLSNTKIFGVSGIQITIREIPIDPPPLEAIGLTKEHAIYQNFFPKQGMVLVTGPTGSGKSTLMASCLAANVAEEDCHRVYNTYESPIEFVYDNIVKPSARVFQTSVPDGIHSFKRGIENSLRRKPEVIVVGEMRDPETIAAAIDAGQTGHLVVGTTHTTGVPATARRLITVFPANERDGRQADIIDQMHMIVAQKLLRTVDGKRVAVRETLIFDPMMKDGLLAVDPLRLTTAIRRIMEEKNIGMLLEAKRYFDEGIISAKEYDALARTFQGEMG